MSGTSFSNSVPPLSFRSDFYHRVPGWHYGVKIADFREVRVVLVADVFSGDFVGTEHIVGLDGGVKEVDTLAEERRCSWFEGKLFWEGWTWTWSS